MSIPTREAYGKALATLGADHSFMVLDADLSGATQTKIFAKAFPERFFNMGIAEGDMMTTAAGMSTTGKTVFASTFAMFAAGRAYEQIRNSIAYTGLNVKIGATHGGVMIGEDGASHQCIEDISLMRTIPNMTVIVPCDEYGVFEAVKAAIEHDGPVYLRFGRGACDDVYTPETANFTIGKGNLLRDGSDLTIIAIGDLVAEGLKAAAALEAKGVSAAVIDMACVKPIDRELVLTYAKKTGKVITAEDHSIIGGLGGAVAEILAEQPIASLRRVGVNDEFGGSASRGVLQKQFNLTADGILEAYSKF